MEAIKLNIIKSIFTGTIFPFFVQLRKQLEDGKCLPVRWCLGIPESVCMLQLVH